MIKERLYLSAEILAWLLNDAPDQCRAPWSVEQIAECVNTCFSCAGLLEVAETERRVLTDAESETTNG